MNPYVWDPSNSKFMVAALALAAPQTDEAGDEVIVRGLGDFHLLPGPSIDFWSRSRYQSATFATAAERFKIAAALLGAAKGEWASMFDGLPRIPSTVSEDRIAFLSVEETAAKRARAEEQDILACTAPVKEPSRRSAL